MDLIGRTAWELETRRSAKELRSLDLEAEGGPKKPRPEILGVFEPESDSDSELVEY